MVRHLVSIAAEHAEDFAQLLGALLIAGGLGWRVGWWAALVAAGILAIAWAIWIQIPANSKGGPGWASQARDEE